MNKLIFILIFACFLIFGKEVSDTTKKDTILRPMVSIFEQNKIDQIQKQFEINDCKLDTINTKLDSIVKILKNRKNDN